MKLTWIIFIGVMALLATYGVWHNQQVASEVVATAPGQTFLARSDNGGLRAAPKLESVTRENQAARPAYKGKLPRFLLADSITAYGLKLIGTPYLYAGITCNGFDCSGFIHHIFGHYGVALPHASALLIDEGTEVLLADVQKGDLLIFTGPGATERKPGHVGVVITEKGESPEFVHSSSAGGVKVSKVAGTGYEKRFLEARRVL